MWELKNRILESSMEDSTLKSNKMRQPDINRVLKAKQHIKAATALLKNIKWENRSMMEDGFINTAIVYVNTADYSLDDIININKNKNEK